LQEVNHVIEVELYSTADGKEPVQKFLDSLSPKLHAKAIHEIEMLEEFGHELREPYVKHIDGELWELRIKFASDISRIFLLYMEQRNHCFAAWLYQKDTENAASRN